jgi:PAS domain S-box-containing protein
MRVAGPQRTATVTLWACAMTLALAATAAPQASSAAPAAAARRIVYGGDEAFAPYESLDLQGRPRGFNIDLVRALAQKGGVAVEFRLGPWRSVLGEAEAGRIDLVSLARTDAREGTFDFIAESWTLRQGALIVGDRPEALGFADLASELVAVEERSAIHDLLLELPEMQRPTLRLARNHREALEMLLRGDASAVAGNLLVLRREARGRGLRLPREIPLKAFSYELATRSGRGAEFAWIPPAMAELRREGVRDRLVELHLSDAEPGVARWLPALAAAGLLALGLTYAWAHSLRSQVRARTRELRAALEERSTLARAFQDSEARLRLLIDQLPAALFTTDQELRVTSCRGSALGPLGEQPAVGVLALSWLGEAEAAGAAGQALRRALRGESGGFEIARGGRHFEAFVEPLRDEHGRVIGTLSLALDVARQRRLEHAIRLVAEAVSADTGDAFFQALTQALADTLGFAHAFVGEIADPGARRIRTLAFRADGELRPGFVYELEGAPCDRVVGHSLCVFPDSVQALFPNDAALGRLGAVCYLGAPLFDSAGRPLGLLAVMDRRPLRDRQLAEAVLRIFAARASAELERKRAEEALRASEAKFSRAFHSSPDPVLITSVPDGRLLEVNEGFCRLAGLERAEVIGRTALELGLWTLPEERERMHALAGRGELRDLECHFRARDGRLLICLVSGERIELDGEPRLLTVIRDVTERRRLEEQVQRQERLKDEFVAMAAHELKTPIAIMKGYAQVLAGRDETPERRALYAAIERGADRLDRKLLDLLDVTSLQIGRYDLVREPFDAAELAAELVEDLRVHARGHAIELDQEGPLPLVADRNRIAQVLLNLLGNAVKHSPAGGSVRVSSLRREGRAIISVADEGVGIPADRQAGIFERFYRAHAGTPHDYGGLGVGLYLSREIARRHGGDVWFESEEGRGSRFHLALPLAEA